MKFLRVISLVAVVSLPGIVAQVYGHQDQRDEKQGKPESQQGRSEH